MRPAEVPSGMDSTSETTSARVVVRIVRLLPGRPSSTTGKRGEDVLPKIPHVEFQKKKIKNSHCRGLSAHNRERKVRGGERARAVLSKHGLACRRCVPSTRPAVGFGCSHSSSQSHFCLLSTTLTRQKFALPCRRVHTLEGLFSWRQPTAKISLGIIWGGGDNNLPFPLHGFESIRHRHRGQKQI